jgi:imidazole glycerol phosphate synthase glutamine amidotransferase subunit
LQRNKSFFGICLGMQLLLDSSEESENVQGLGFFQGTNRRFQKNKVPQIGWNQIKIQKSSMLFEGIEDNSFFYLLHSYYVDPIDEGIISATTDYGIEYPAVIEKGNVYAVQFHPEKSGASGLRLLKNWVEKC